jgi:hypothetical protein
LGELSGVLRLQPLEELLGGPIRLYMTGVNYFCRLATTILAGLGFSLLPSSRLLEGHQQ